MTYQDDYTDDKSTASNWSTVTGTTNINQEHPDIGEEQGIVNYEAAKECVQDMLFGMHLLESMGLKVKKPMVLEVDNKGTKDLAHNWSVGGRTRHIATKISFLRELKEEGTIIVKWIPTTNNTSDLFNKNLGGSAFEWQTSYYVGEDEYMNNMNKKNNDNAQGENVGSVNENNG
jgi:hypothetical protein